MSTPIVGALNMGSMEAVWLFFELTVPFTIVTFLVWVLVHYYTKSKENAKEIDIV